MTLQNPAPNVRVGALLSSRTGSLDHLLPPPTAPHVEDYVDSEGF
jgi:hypothetical protein